MQGFIKTLAVGLLGGVIGSGLIIKTFTNKKLERPEIQTVSNFSTPNYYESVLPEARSSSLISSENFVEASRKSTSSVVFIQTLSEYDYRSGGWMDWFFEPRSSQQVGSGSGVVFSENGYIVTNNHVIEDADEITVIAGKQSFSAELIGRDPSSDLAVIKIEPNQLPAIEIGDSKEVSVGEWVLAVGNPFNLTSTVTAGIVSAKGRNLNLLRDKFPIESFIQTDAAINPGNSGGALVNTKGQLIGINTAILSRTGSYAGYGFAIPVNIVKKIFNDIVKYGEIQKAFFGAEFLDIDSDLADRLDIDDLDGVLIADVGKGSASELAKLEKGDVIKQANGDVIRNKANLEELIANSYPGDQLDLLIERNGKLLPTQLILTNREGKTGVIKREVYTSKKLQVTFERVSKVERDLLGISSGVKIVDIEKNGMFSELSVPEGFIITQINSKLVTEPKEVATILENIRGRFDVIGINARGRKVYYPFRR